MTEDEAKTKWCPFVGTPRYTKQEEECIGSRCMAWVWDNKKLGHDPNHKGQKAADEFTRSNPLHGHCGAARGERDEHGFPVFRHEPLTRAEGEEIWKRARQSDQERKERMPDELSAINALHDAWVRLKDFGWKEPVYCPKDGRHFHIIELGSTGVFEGAYRGEWPNGHWDSWDGHDSYCSSIAPAMFKLFTKDKVEEDERWKDAGRKLREALTANPPDGAHESE